MKLYSGTPIWFETCQAPSFPDLAEDLRCQVAIVGGGITGTLVASQLLDLGMEIALFDKRNPGSGSTAASTGLLTYETDWPLVKLAKVIGVDPAARAYRLGCWAIDKIESLVHELGRPCGFQRCRSLYTARTYWQSRQLQSEYNLRRIMGLEVSYLSGLQLRRRFGIKRRGAIVSKNCGQINPLQFTTQLLTQVARRGAKIFQNAAVGSVEKVTGGFQLNVQGYQIRAEQVVFTTGYEVPAVAQFVPNSLRTTYVAVSRANEMKVGWPPQCLYWEMGRPYLYARETDDGRLLIGGQDTAFAGDHRREYLVARQTQKVLQQFRKIFPEAHFEVENTWAGTFAESSDGLPYIGQLGSDRGLYAALGFGGNGITFAAIAARLIGDLLKGAQHRDAQIFRLDR